MVLDEMAKEKKKNNIELCYQRSVLNIQIAFVTSITSFLTECHANQITLKMEYALQSSIG